VRLTVIVIGLGRFGGSVAAELERLGHEVLGIDRDGTRVDELATRITRAVQLDAGDERALTGLASGGFDVGVVAMSSAEPSVFAATILKRVGLPRIIAKAGSDLHASVLHSVGADRVVFPERELGEQVARTIAVPNVLEYLEVAPGVGIEKLTAPAKFVGRTLGELGLKEQHGLTPLALRREKDVIVNPSGSERIREGDELIVIGRDEKVESLRG
jgi:trk system potassium uptake protein TrkA